MPRVQRDTLMCIKIRMYVCMHACKYVREYVCTYVFTLPSELLGCSKFRDAELQGRAGGFLERGSTWKKSRKERARTIIERERERAEQMLVFGVQRPASPVLSPISDPLLCHPIAQARNCTERWTGSGEAHACTYADTSIRMSGHARRKYVCVGS